MGYNYNWSGTITTDLYIHASNGGVEVTGSSSYLRNVAGSYGPGVIIAQSGAGVRLIDGGSVYNGPGATITGSTDGIRADQLATVMNRGHVYGAAVGVALDAGGTVQNSGGSIVGNDAGVVIGASGTINADSGVIGGHQFAGIDLLAGGKVAVGQAGSVYGGRYGVYGYGVANVNNAGTISDTERLSGSGNNTGVALRAGGFLSNSGRIEGGSAGVYGGSAGVYVNPNAQASVVQNSGVIIAYQAHGAGVYLRGFGQAATQGFVMNVVGGTIIGDQGARLALGGYVGNAGDITGTAGAGVYITGGGTVVNQDSGTISGGSYGVELVSAGGSVSNAGTITGNIGVELRGFGTVSNLDGHISAISTGVVLQAGGTLTNSAGASIYAYKLGVSMAGSCSLVNAGSIIALDRNAVGMRVGVYLKGAGGSIVNAASGYINGYYGVIVSSGGTVTNAGYIGGGYGAITFRNGGSATVILDPGGVCAGIVSAVSATSGTLDLASAASAGTITGIGGHYVGFGTVNVQAGAAWTFSGSNNIAAGATLNDAGTLTGSGALVVSGTATVSGTLEASGAGLIEFGGGLRLVGGAHVTAGSTGVIEIGSKGGAAAGVVTVDPGGQLTGAGTIVSRVVDKGSIVAQGGTLAFLGGISGGGSLCIDPHAVVSLAGGLSVSKLMFLSGGNETAVFGLPISASSTISGFNATTDAIDLKGFAATSLSFAGHTLTVNRAIGSAAHLGFAGNYLMQNFSFGSDHHGGTTIHFV